MFSTYPENAMAKVQNTNTKDDEIVAEIPMACADEASAVEFMEKQRWGDHPACPQCGDLDVYKMMNKERTQRQANYRWRCNGCKEQFTVRVGTVFEDSRIPMRHWCYGFWRASTSKKGVSALEIKRHTGLSYKSALFLLHRIRFAMQDTATDMLSGDVEVDEVYIGGRARNYNGSRKTKKIPKTMVLAMKERGGRIRPKVVADITGATVKSVMLENIDKSARLLTDEWTGYRTVGKEFAGGHETVRHWMHEYARGDVTTNSVEGFFGMLRRGLDGIYHSVSRKHLHRYLSEFQFRHDHRELSDGQRTIKAIKAATGRRLTYQQQVYGG
jgi:transposase-like protein